MMSDLTEYDSCTLNGHFKKVYLEAEDNDVCPSKLMPSLVVTEKDK